MPEAASVQGDAALVDPFVGEFGYRIDFEARAVSVGAYDLEARAVGVELLADVERYNGGVVPGEEVLVAWLEGPVVDFAELSVAFLEELLPAPVYRVVGGHWVVYEL